MRLRNACATAGCDVECEHPGHERQRHAPQQRREAGSRPAPAPAARPRPPRVGKSRRRRHIEAERPDERLRRSSPPSGRRRPRRPAARPAAPHARRSCGRAQQSAVHVQQVVEVDRAFLVVREISGSSTVCTGLPTTPPRGTRWCSGRRPRRCSTSNRSSRPSTRHPPDARPRTPGSGSPMRSTSRHSSSRAGCGRTRMPMSLQPRVGAGAEARTHSLTNAGSWRCRGRATSRRRARTDGRGAGRRGRRTPRATATGAGRTTGRSTGRR